MEVGKGAVRLAEQQVVTAGAQQVQALGRGHGHIHLVAHLLQGVRGQGAPAVGDDGHQGRGDIGRTAAVARVQAVGEPVRIRRRRGKRVRLLVAGGGGEEIGEQVERAFSCETIALHCFLC